MDLREAIKNRQPINLDTKEKISGYYISRFRGIQSDGWIQRVSTEHYLLHLRNSVERLEWELTESLSGTEIEMSKWLCSCGEINSTEDCIGKSKPQLQCIKEKGHKGFHDFYGGVSDNRCEYIEVITHTKVRDLEKKDMADEKVDLFKKFYQDEKVLISNMTSEDFKIHEESLAQIAFEAKARITAVIDYKKEVNASLRLNQKEWLIEKNDAEDQLVSDAINVVQSRKKRMNKIEKLNEMLSGFVDEETRKTMIQAVERKATESQVNLISFVKTKETEVKKEIAENKEATPLTEPFDITKLKF